MVEKRPAAAASVGAGPPSSNGKHAKAAAAAPSNSGAASLEAHEAGLLVASELLEDPVDAACSGAGSTMDGIKARPSRTGSSPTARVPAMAPGSLTTQCRCRAT